MCAISLAILVPAAFADDLITGKGEQWKVYNGEPATASFWDINKAQIVGGAVVVPIQQFVSTTTGSFVIYLLNDYNVNLTGQTITAEANWTPGVAAGGSGTYETRSTVFSGAYVRVEFQDVASGHFTSNDYWWNSGSLDLNAVSSGTLTAPLTNRSQWTNICGQSATDKTAHPGPNCVGGTDPAVSPYDGFTNAMKNVKLIGISFGSSGSYASGIALYDATGTFTLTNFTISQ